MKYCGQIIVEECKKSGLQLYRCTRRDMMSEIMMDDNGEKKIDDKTMDNVEILAKLALTGEERYKAMAEMEKILSYVDKLNELDTKDVEPLVHVMPHTNVFREDEIENDDGAEATLSNAPKKKENQFMVPKTV